MEKRRGEKTTLVRIAVKDADFLRTLAHKNGIALGVVVSNLIDICLQTKATGIATDLLEGSIDESIKAYVRKHCKPDGEELAETEASKGHTKRAK